MSHDKKPGQGLKLPIKGFVVSTDELLGILAGRKQTSINLECGCQHDWYGMFELENVDHAGSDGGEA